MADEENEKKEENEKDDFQLQELRDPVVEGETDVIEEQEDRELSLDVVESLAAVYNVPVQVSAALGHATMPVNQLLKLGRGAVIELDRRVGESVDIFVNNRLIARGEVVVVDDRLGITMTEIIKKS